MLSNTMVAVDYSKAPVPPHYYVADYFEVVNLDPQVLFIFGKLDYPAQDRLRSKLEIDFPALLFMAQLWKSQQEFHKTLRAYVKEFGYQAANQGSISGPVERIQTIHSNNALMIMTGGECMIDFFYMSPRDLALEAPRGGNISLEPLVRVITSPNILLGFLDACEPVAASLMPKFGSEVEHESVEFK